jgi:tryptophanyl-tRNA synthetase
MVEQGCRSGSLGCVDCKKLCSANISEELAPMLERRRYFEERPDMVREILHEGETKARRIARETMNEVRQAMHLGESVL